MLGHTAFSVPLNIGLQNGRHTAAFGNMGKERGAKEHHKHYCLEVSQLMTKDGSSISNSLFVLLATSVKYIAICTDTLQILKEVPTYL